MFVVSVPVHIFHHTPDLTASPQSTVSLSCSAVGYPAPMEVAWISPLREKIERTSHSLRGKRTVTLTVNISLSDNGHTGGYFTCVATNSMKSANAKTTLSGNTGKHS